MDRGMGRGMGSGENEDPGSKNTARKILKLRTMQGADAVVAAE